MAIENSEATASEAHQQTGGLSSDLFSGDRQATLNIVKAQRNQPAPRREADEPVPLPRERPVGQAPNPDSCPVSPEYNKLLTKAARNMYDPASLGSLKTAFNKYNCDIKDANDAVAKAHATLQATGDHYNQTLTAEQVKEMRQQQQGRLSGVGMRLQTVETKPADELHRAEVTTMVEDAAKDTPAEKAGFQHGDFIVKVNGVDTSKMDAGQIANLIRGVAGTTVDLTAIRNGAPIERTLTREDLRIPSVSQPQDMGDGITYLKFYEFNEDSSKHLQNAIDATPNARGYVIDLRNNPGGLFDEAINAAELFIKKGDIVSESVREDSDPSKPVYSSVRWSVDAKSEITHERMPGDQEERSNPRPRSLPYVLNGRPVILLINGGSASSSEILAGALHDNHVAETVGDRSFGKGIAQTIFWSVANGAAVKVTSARYFNPSGFWPGDAMSTPTGERGPNRIGLKPDHEVANPRNTVPRSPQDAQLNAGVDLLRRKLGQQPSKP